jgi:peptide/nickel transport system permease protein
MRRSSLFLILMTMLALLAPLVAPHDPYGVDVSQRLLPPCREFLFGTDHLGRCVFSRVLFGARVSLGIGCMIMVSSLTLGGIIGAVAGMGSTLADGIIMRITDVFMAVPSLVFALVLSRSLGPGTMNVILIFSLTLWTRYARMVRGLVLDLRHRDHVATAALAGLPPGHILLHHILPGLIPPMAAMATLGMGMNILMVSSLSFLGLGIVEPVPDWGAMLATGTDYFRTAPHMALFPGLVISLTVLAFNSLGDHLQAWRINPKSSGRPNGKNS